MRKLRKFVVQNEFEDYLPKVSDFRIVEETILPLGKNDFLVKTEYISVDPYMRSFATDRAVPYDQFGFQVGKVIESKNSEYPVGIYVVSHSGWCDYAVLNGAPDDVFEMKPYQPEVGSLPVSLSLGALGMPGMTAYLGLSEVCRPNKGDVVCVTGAAGAVGSLVGQIARLKGCTVIGIAGSDRKVQVLKQELGFHHALNYRAENNIEASLKSIAPTGIDCYFDNVGGRLSSDVMKAMKMQGRVAVCGAISTYGGQSPSVKRTSLPMSLNIEAFSFTQWERAVQRRAVVQIKEWVAHGTVKAYETITSGFEQLPDAFIGMLTGQNIGKAIVKV